MSDCYTDMNVVPSIVNFRSDLSPINKLFKLQQIFNFGSSALKVFQG